MTRILYVGSLDPLDNLISGDIVNDLGPQAVRKDRFAPGLELAFSLGSGDARISVSTFSGTVEIRETENR